MDCSIRANASKYIIRSPKVGIKLVDALERWMAD